MLQEGKTEKLCGCTTLAAVHNTIIGRGRYAWPNPEHEQYSTREQHQKQARTSIAFRAINLSIRSHQSWHFYNKRKNTLPVRQTASTQKDWFNKLQTYAQLLPLADAGEYHFVVEEGSSVRGHCGYAATCACTAKNYALLQYPNSITFDPSRRHTSSVVSKTSYVFFHHPIPKLSFICFKYNLL